ncbi:MAG TPA: hypothetical protein VIN62_03335 [Candidatus Cryosericum sp.]|nr:hypothetical protein [Candidatus Cryosericum sp.]
MKKRSRSISVSRWFMRNWHWLTVVVLVMAAVVSATLWTVRGSRSSLHAAGQFKTNEYPVAVTGTAEQGYALTAGGQVFTLKGWTQQSEGVELADNATSMVLSASGRYLLVLGDRVTLLDSALQQKWSRKTTAPSVVERGTFTTKGQVTVVYSFLADQSRQCVTYDLAGKYLTGYKVPDFGRDAQVDLASTGTLVLTLAGGNIYTVSPDGKVIATFTVPNPDVKLAGLVSAVDATGTRILAGYGRAVSGTADSLPRYVFDQTGKQVAEFAVPAENPAVRAVGGSFLLFGRSAQLVDKDGKVLWSASKLNFGVIDAASADGVCSVLFQEETTSQTPVYYLGVYDGTTGALLHQWSTAEAEAPRLFQLPGGRSVLALGTGFLVLEP